MIEQYNGYLIYGAAIAAPPPSLAWRSEGTVFTPGRLGSVIQVKRIDGRTFITKEEAEARGLELCRAWIDAQVSRA
jgi:hypothetical protein